MKAEERLLRLMISKGLRISVAESCTGGLIAERITGVAGSSEYFETAIVTYSNRAKTLFLAVPEGMIAAHGAVSREVAQSMAEGVRKAAGTDIGLSVTGIAGPAGGSDFKPVGTVFIGMAFARASIVKGFHFTGDRKRIRQQASEEALRMVIGHLEE